MTYIGVDLGKINDFTALCIVERAEMPVDEEWEETRAEYHVRHLERHLGKTYTAIADRIIEVREFTGEETDVVVDATGVGRPVVDLLTERGLTSIVPVLITGGDTVNRENGEFRVPKRDLVGAMQVLTQNAELKIPASLELRDALVTEMQNFKVKRSEESGHESFEHWRSGDHDDLVLALALSLWYGEYMGRRRIDYSRGAFG